MANVHICFLTWSGLQEEALKRVCVGETLCRKGVSWPRQCARQVPDKGIKISSQMTMLRTAEVSILLQKVTRTWSWDISQKQWSFPQRKSVLVRHREIRAKKICPKIRALK